MSIKAQTFKFEITKKPRGGGAAKIFEVSVDTQDAARVKEHPWHIHNGTFAATVVYEDGPDGETLSENIYLHRFVLADEIGEHEASTGKRARVGFVDGNRLNCTRDNLVIQKPRVHKKPRRPTTSKYKGVSFIRTTGKWRTKLMYDGKNIIERQFSTEHEALVALNIAKERLNLEIAAGDYGTDIEPLTIQKWNGDTIPSDMADSSKLTPTLRDHINTFSAIDIGDETATVIVTLGEPAENGIKERLRKLGFHVADGLRNFLAPEVTIDNVCKVSHLREVSRIATIVE